MPYPQANYQRLVYGEYPVATYRSACQAAVRMALVKEAWWKHINPITYTTVGSSHLLRNKFLVVRVKLRAGHAKAKLDVFALEDALEGAAESGIDMNYCTHKCKTDMYSVCFEISTDASHLITLHQELRVTLANNLSGDFTAATIKRWNRRAEISQDIPLHSHLLRDTNCNISWRTHHVNNCRAAGVSHAPQSISNLYDGRENPLAQHFVYTKPTYGDVHDTGDYAPDPRARFKTRHLAHGPHGGLGGSWDWMLM